MDQSQPLLGLYSGITQFNLGITNTYISGVRRIRQRQLEQISATASDVEALGKQIEGVQDFGALNSLHVTMLEGYAVRISNYWSKLAEDWSALQMEMSGLLQDSGSKAAENFRQQMEQLQSSMAQGMSKLLKPGTDPMSQATVRAAVQNTNTNSSGGSSDTHSAVVRSSSPAKQIGR